MAKYRMEPGKGLVRIDEKEPLPQEPAHDEIRDIIVKIGKLRGLTPESEYPLDNRRLNAIWKRV